MQSELNVPPGYVELLEDFTISVLQTKPTDVISYAIEYFTKLKGESSPGNQETGANPPVILLKSRSAKEEETDSTDRFAQNNAEGYEDAEDEEEDDSIPQIRLPLRARRASVAAEPYNPDEDTEDDEDEDEDQGEKNQAVDAQLVDDQSPRRAMLLQMCKKIMLFRGMEEKELDKVIRAMSEKAVQPGDRIIEQGEHGDNFYVIESGTYDVLVRDETGKDKVVFQYQNEGFFGELALMYNAPRSATVIAQTEGCIWSMARKDFQRLVMSHAARQRRAFMQLLHSVNILQGLSPNERMNLADALFKRTCEDGEYIIQEGEPGREMYFIMEGKVKVERTAKDGSKQVMTQLGKGQYFGELALLSDQPRAASVIALGKVVLAVLGVESFERLLGPCVDVMRRNTANYVEPSLL